MNQDPAVSRAPYRSKIILDPGLLLVVLLSLFAIWPLLAPGLPNTADGLIHFYRAVDMQQAWRDAVFYPRWSANLALGYGTPLFNFAPPLIYLLMMALNRIGLDLALAMKGVVILFILISALGTYLLGRETLGRQAGLVAAAAYLYAPYRLREMYIQGNYAQFLGLACYPLVLWCYFQVIQTGKMRYIIGGAFAYAALLLSHNISAMIFSPVLAAYAIFWLLQRKRWSALRDLIVSAILGLGLSAFFWLPAFYESRWIQLSQITKGHFDFRLHFLSLEELFSANVPLDYAAVNVYFPLSIGRAMIALATMALLATLLARDWRPGQRALLWFSAAIAGIGFFVMLRESTRLWEIVPLLNLTEFPWRLLGVTAVPMALLAGGSIYFLRWVLPPKLAGLVPALGLIVILVPSLFYLFPDQPFVDMSGATVKDISAYELRTKAFGTTSAGEFLPIWTVPHPTDSPMVADYQAGRPVDKLDRTSVPIGVKVQEMGRGYQWNEYSFEAPEPFQARFNTLWFPGWQIYLDDQPVPSGAAQPTGQVSFLVPAGTHRVRLSFETTPVRQVAEIISALALAACVVLAVLHRRWPRTQPDAVPLTARARWPRPVFFWSAGTLVVLLVAKEAFIGPYTNWFRVHSPPGQVTGVQHPAHVLLGDQATFLGYDLEGNAPGQGSPVTVRAYWQASPQTQANYRSFVHLDALPDLKTVAQSDAMHPGGIPMTTWPPDFYSRDEHHLTIPADLPPGVYALRTGLYNGDTGQRLPVLNEQGQPAGDAIPLQGLRVTRTQPLQADQLPQHPHVSFGDQIDLVSYKLAEGSGGLDVTLYWQAGKPLPADYTVFVHVVDEAGRILAQSDSPPASGRYPTSYWLPGEIVEDTRQVSVPGGLQGAYKVWVGLYPGDNPARLEARDAQGSRLPDDQARLEF